MKALHLLIVLFLSNIPSAVLDCEDVVVLTVGAVGVGGIASVSYMLINYFELNPLLTFDPERE